MNEIVVIEKTKLQRIEYQGKPIITLPMIDKAHGRPTNTAQRTFQKLKKEDRFVEGEDFYEVSYEEWSSLIIRNTYDQNSQKGGRRGSMIFLTMTGYLMLAKPLTDDRSWDVQRSLVNHYFSSEKAIAQYKETIEILQEKCIEALDDANAYKRLYIDKITQKPRQPMKDYERRQIIDLKCQGKTTSAIVKKTGWSGSTVNKVVRKAREAGELPPMPWSEKLKLIHLHPEFFQEVR